MTLYPHVMLETEGQHETHRPHHHYANHHLAPDNTMAPVMQEMCVLCVLSLKEFVDSFLQENCFTVSSFPRCSALLPSRILAARCGGVSSMAAVPKPSHC